MSWRTKTLNVIAKKLSTVNAKHSDTVQLRSSIVSFFIPRFACSPSRDLTNASLVRWILEKKSSTVLHTNKLTFYALKSINVKFLADVIVLTRTSRWIRWCIVCPSVKHFYGITFDVLNNKKKLWKNSNLDEQIWDNNGKKHLPTFHHYHILHFHSSLSQHHLLQLFPVVSLLLQLVPYHVFRLVMNSP